MLNKLVLTIILLVALFGFQFSCCAKKDVIVPKDHCGFCQSEEKSVVCTKQGSLYNNCLAICRGAEILCKGPCPCSK